MLLCTEDVDNFALDMLMDYQGKPLKNVSSSDLGLDTEDEKEAAKVIADENKALIEAMKEALGDKVTQVVVSTRIADAAACITTEGPLSLEMERILSSAPSKNEEYKTQRVLELNPAHPVFEVLKDAQAAGDSEKISSYADLLYNQALLMEGIPVEDPIAFAQEIAKLMV